MASEKDILPLTFAEKMAARRIEAKLAKPASPPTKAKARVKDDDLYILYTLLDANITDWEESFCNSVIAYLKKPGASLSVKQAAVLDKLDGKYLENTLDPTPVGNPPAQYSSDIDKIKDKLQNSVGFDDMDDDIPY